MNLDTDELAILLLALEHYVECQLDGDVDEVFPEMLSEGRFDVAHDKLAEKVNSDDELVTYFRNLYAKLKEATE